MNKIDNIDIEATAKSGIKVVNTPNAPAEAVAELTIGLILAILPKIPLMDREMHDGLWNC